MSVIEFPGPFASSDNLSENEIHAEAFRDLEPHICDRVMMSEIAVNQLKHTDRSGCLDQRLNFAVCHLHEMLLNL